MTMERRSLARAGASRGRQGQDDRRLCRDLQRRRRHWRLVPRNHRARRVQGHAGGDIRALVDHDSGRVIGRSKAGTLRLNEDDKGLAVEIDLPDTTDGRDLA
jgi:hypothetical protein